MSNSRTKFLDCTTVIISIKLDSDKNKSWFSSMNSWLERDIGFPLIGNVNFFFNVLIGKILKTN